jgi:hypothetical protein
MMVSGFMKLFEEINVWERKSAENITCYRCFKLIPDGGYCVQSADYYYSNQERNFKQQFIELLLEDSPDLRSSVFASLEEAILNFNDQF